MSKAEKFIQEHTKNCSNLMQVPTLDDRGNIVPEAHPWLTPDQARRAVEIAREEMIEWLKDNASKYIINTTPSYPDADFNAIIGGKCWEDLKQAMKDEKRRDMEWLFPELRENKDEKIRKWLIDWAKAVNWSEQFTITKEQVLAWLEKQGYTKKDIDNAYLKGICDTKHELEKQGEQKPAVVDFNAKDWYVSKVDGKIHDMTYNPADKVEPFDKYEGLTDFERTLADICIGWIGEELGWKQYIKDNADVLLKIAIKKFNSIQDAPFEQKSAWSEEDEEMTDDVIKGCVSAEKAHHFIHTPKEVSDWLKLLKDRIICKNTI